ncbi:MAG: lysophospholipid acyltransferase family protein [Chthoniobacterales bacterium]|nr:lysophospholipid acyltransferase family protein [Chthoniobacterales bacterium]
MKHRWQHSANEQRQLAGAGSGELKIHGWPARVAIACGYRLLQLWARTLRFEIEDRAGVVGTAPNERYIGALWHNRLLLLPHVLKHYLPQRQGAALISASRDGDLLADLVQRFGYNVVRGSSSRKGVTAMLQLADVMARGRDAVMTPDGPRGPVYRLGGGIVFLAQKSGAGVVPINMEYSSSWRLRSWDRFILPRPFSKVRVIFAEPHRVPPTNTEAEFEAERLRLQNAMMQIVEMH